MIRVYTHLALLVTLMSLSPSARAEPLVVVVGKSSPVSELSTGDLQRIFLSMPMQNGEGTPFVPFNYPAKTPVRERFDRIILGMSPEEVGQHWIDQRIRGKPAPPRTIQSPALLCRVVAKVQGAIAYMPASLLGPQCKAVTIDGRKHIEAGYVFAAESSVLRVASRDHARGSGHRSIKTSGSSQIPAHARVALAPDTASCQRPRWSSRSSPRCSRHHPRRSRARGTA